MFDKKTRIALALAFSLVIGLFAVLNILDWYTNHAARYSPFDLTPVKRSARSPPEPERPRIFCMIVTSAKNLNRKAVYVQQTWAYQCDGHKFFSLIPEEYISNNPVLMGKRKRGESIEFNSTMLPLFQPAGLKNDSYSKLTDKVFLMIKDVYKHYGGYDWYLKADDDTMIFMDNLRDFLADKDPLGKYTYGYNYKVLVPNGYHSGGGGYVLPRKALQDLGAKLKKSFKSCGNCGVEDVDVARCLRSLRYQVGHSLDEKNRERFHPLSMKDHYKGNFPKWLLKNAQNPVKNGTDCCAESSISFHYTRPNELAILGELVRDRTRKVTFHDAAVAIGLKKSDQQGAT